MQHVMDIILNWHGTVYGGILLVGSLIGGGVLFFRHKLSHPWCSLHQSTPSE